MFFQANCSAVVKQLIKLYTHNIYGTWFVFAVFSLAGASFELSRELLLSKCKTFEYGNREMNSKYVRCNMKQWKIGKYCSNHSIGAQVWFCSFCIQASFIFYQINASLHHWELVVKSSSYISLHFLPLSRNCLCSSIWQVSWLADLKPIFMHFPTNTVLLDRPSFPIALAWAALHQDVFCLLLLSSSLSLSLSTQWIWVNWWIQMSPNVPSTRQKSAEERMRGKVTE